MKSRREAITAGIFGVGSLPTLITGRALAASASATEGGKKAASEQLWKPGIEGQRTADLGNGTYRNPIMAGAYSDPTILKDGADYYMTFSSFDADPGLLIWHSQDLVNWRPLTAVLPQPLGSVFAVDLVKHNGRYFIYIPFVPAPWSDLKETGIYVIHADRIDGDWSKPIDLGIRGRIDPGHAVGEDGARYLFLSAGHRVKLTPDGLATAGPIEKVYAGWKYPDDWITEAYALEGPKIVAHGGYFYLISAVGGTGGPPTGHMVIAARSRSINGPWEDCPQNPIVRTQSADEAWWSRGHASLVEGPAGDWWMVYHGYENGYRTLGRQTLLEPIKWTDDGWFRGLGGDLSLPIAKPRNGRSGPHGMARSDDFSTPSIGTRWVFQAPGRDETKRLSFESGSMLLKGSGTGPHDSAPLTNLAGDQSYEITIAVQLIGDVTGGMLLFLSNRLFVGMAIDGQRLVTYGGGRVHYWREDVPPTSKIHLRIVNDRHITTFYYSLDGRSWTQHGLRMETSGYNANTLLPGEGESLRPAIFAAGPGSVRFREFSYRALSDASVAR